MGDVVDCINSVKFEDATDGMTEVDVGDAVGGEVSLIMGDVVLTIVEEVEFTKELLVALFVSSPAKTASVTLSFFASETI